MSEFRQCPFCAEEKSLELEPQYQSELRKKAWAVTCHGCHATGPFFLEAPDAAVESWNRRGRQAPFLTPEARKMTMAKRIEGVSMAGVMPCPFCESLDIKVYALGLPFCRMPHYIMSCNFCDAGGPMAHDEIHTAAGGSAVWNLRIEKKKEAAVA